MLSDIEPLKKWFGYTRKERRASAILLAIMLALLLVRVALPEKTMVLEDISAQIAFSGSGDQATHSFIFDPNTASYDTLIMLGLGEKEARTLISYRTKGGRFRQPSDIRRLYGLGQEKADALQPLIVIKQDTLKKYPRKRPLVDLNNCDSAMLERLPGIGPVLSARIIKYRNLLGGYASVSQLNEVYGLHAETFEMIRDRVSADSSDVRKINLNTAEYRVLSRFPYLENYDVASILRYRDIEGRISSVNELAENKIISDSIARKIRPYVIF